MINRCLSRARTQFTSFGRISVKQRDLVTTRTITIEQSIEETTTITTGGGGGGGTGGQPPHVPERVTLTIGGLTFTQYKDPLAQTFLVNAQEGLPGAFVTSVDVFLRSLSSDRR